MESRKSLEARSEDQIDIDLQRQAASPASSRLPKQAAGMTRAVSFIALGNVLSRILGLARETVIANLFGASALVSAFQLAQTIPTMLYDLVIGGMVSSALVPVFSEHAERDRAELWHLASLVLSLAVIVLGVVVFLIELAAPQVVSILAGGFDSEELRVVTTHLIRITTPAVLFLSLSGIITGLLHALRRFALPAFSAAIFNATIVAVALIGVRLWGWDIEALAIGLLLGALLQVILQLPGLYDARLRFALDLHHPALRRIGKLYLPVILGLVISQVAVALDRIFAIYTGEQSLAWMRFATTIIQFPLGLVSVAVSLAILPTLSRLASAATDTTIALDEFMNTLTTGLRLVLILMIPATLALFVLAEPLIALIFQHGDFNAFDTRQTALALRFYLPGLTFAAIDQPLIFAFYARQNTLTPALVGLLAVGFYLAAATLPALVRAMQLPGFLSGTGLLLAVPSTGQILSNMTMTDLVLANSIQLTGHALVMLWLVNRLAPLRRRGLGPTIFKAAGGSLAMGLILWSTLPALRTWLLRGTLITELVFVGVLCLLGGSFYLLTLILLRAEELTLLSGLVHRFLPRFKRKN